MPPLDASTFTVGVLGPLAVGTADGPVEVAGARLRALLTRLAQSAGRPVAAESLAAAVWPEDGPADPASAVRSLVARLRRLLPPGAVASVPGGYRLEADPEAVDLLRFERLAAAGRRALRAGDPAARGLLAEALGLWRGPALADTPDALSAIAALEETRLAAVEDWAEAELASGAAAAAPLPALAEAAAAHPLRERLHALYFRALLAAGQGAEALARYDALRRRLADELGADPGPDLQAVHMRLLEPAPPKPARTRGNLRAPLTSFVGREPERAQIAAALGNARLVTLCGPGGVGKTRLATSAAASTAPPGGAWIAELAPVTDPEGVARAAAEAVGAFDTDPAERRAPAATLELLVEALAGRPALLVLDNCEHLIDAAADFADRLLGACPDLRILATSREPLAITGETVCHIGPLGSQAAQRLFADRAAAVRPGFTVDASNAADVAALCDRLDRLPLAIELAAAKLRTLDLPQVADRLGDRFLLLTGGSRTALPRHQTLRAVVAWSWDLLEPSERDLAESASVFAGGLSIDAAEWLGASLDTLTSLADKSILQSTGSGRFHMLETIREYGQERLAETGRLVKAHEAHAAYALELAEAAEPHLRGPDQIEWMRRLDAERGNLLAAFHFAVGGGDADTAVRLAAAMCIHWLYAGARPEVTGWLDAALAVPGPAPDESRVVVQGMAVINRMMCGTFQTDGIIEEFDAVVRAAAPYPDHPLLVLAEPLLLMFIDEHDGGFACIERRMAHPDPWVRSVLWMLRALLLEDRGEMTEMRVDLGRAASGFRDTGDRFGLYHALNWLAQIGLMFGDLEPAVAALEESIALQRELSPGAAAIQTRTILASALIREGRNDEAREALEAVIAEAEADRDHPSAGREALFAHLGLGDLARLEGRLEDAERHYTVADGLREDQWVIVPPQWTALMSRARIFTALARDDQEGARRLLAESFDAAHSALDMPVLAKVAIAAGSFAAAGGDDAAAAELLGVADELRGAPDRFDVDAAILERALRKRLGAEPFEAAARHGRALDRDAALARLERACKAREPDPEARRSRGASQLD